MSDRAHRPAAHVAGTPSRIDKITAFTGAIVGQPSQCHNSDSMNRLIATAPAENGYNRTPSFQTGQRAS